MSRAARKHPPLKIKRAIVEKLLMYGLSRHEFGALLFSEGNVVTDIRRIRNLESNKKDFFEWDHRQRAVEIKSAMKQGLKLVAEAHSHCGESHPNFPSAMDVKYFDKKIPHIIVHSKTLTLRAWRLDSMAQIDINEV